MILNGTFDQKRFNAVSLAVSMQSARAELSLLAPTEAYPDAPWDQLGTAEKQLRIDVAQRALDELLRQGVIS
jgi:hypothetical protein